MGHVPQRTCIGCREVAGPDRLVRLTVVDERGLVVVPDLRRRLGGRGAWLHPCRDCADAAIRRRAFNRAFRGAVRLEDEAEFLRELLDGCGEDRAPEHDDDGPSRGRIVTKPAALRAPRRHRTDVESEQEADGNPMSAER